MGWLVVRRDDVHDRVKRAEADDDRDGDQDRQDGNVDQGQPRLIAAGDAPADEARGHHVDADEADEEVEAELLVDR